MTIIDTTRAQLFALVRRPATWTLIAAMAVLNQVFAFLIPYLSHRSADPSGFDAGSSPDELLAGTLPGQLVPNTLGGFPVFAGALALGLGALALGSEYGWGTIKTLMTQRPGRSAVLAGQALALLAVVALTVAVLLVLGAVTSVGIALGEGEPAAFPTATHLLKGWATGLLVLSVWAGLGAALAVVLRGVALPIGLGIVWALGIENLVSAMAGTMLTALEPVRDTLPGVNAGSLIGAITPERVGTPAPGITDSVDGTRALLTLSVYVLVALAVAWSVQRRRDLA